MAVWCSYATKIIDEEFYKVEYIKFNEEDKEIKVKLSKDDKESKLTFDSDYKLKEWFSWDYDYAEEPRFELYKSKYLIKAMSSNKFGRMEIQYHEVDGIKLPKNVYLYARNTTAPDGVLSFVSIEK